MQAGDVTLISMLSASRACRRCQVQGFEQIGATQTYADVVSIVFNHPDGRRAVINYEETDPEGTVFIRITSTRGSAEF